MIELLLLVKLAELVLAGARIPMRRLPFGPEMTEVADLRGVAAMTLGGACEVAGSAEMGGGTGCCRELIRERLVGEMGRVRLIPWCGEGDGGDRYEEAPDEEALPE